jgi:hypothetical protein
MYCRQCIKEGKEPVNMQIDVEEECYICPVCGHTIYWENEKEES